MCPHSISFNSDDLLAQPAAPKAVGALPDHLRSIRLMCFSEPWTNSPPPNLIISTANAFMLRIQVLVLLAARVRE